MYILYKKRSSKTPTIHGGAQGLLRYRQAGQGPLGSMGLLRNRQAGAPRDHVSALLAKFKFRLEVVRRVALYHEKG